MSDVQPLPYPQEEIKKQTIVCEDWADFRERISFSSLPGGVGRFRGERIFRGQAKPPPEFTLASAWQRRFPFAVAAIEKSLKMPVQALVSGGSGTTFITSDPEDALERYLNRFRERLDTLPGISVRGWTDEEVLALGRHHSLITTLLDWTTSPYVAAFFALEECYRLLQEGAANLPGNSVVVWCLLLTNELKASMDAPDSPLSIVKARGEGAQRQVAQQGLFTNLRVGRDIETYLFSNGFLDHLTCYEIPPSSHGPAIHDLYLMNIHFATMYPDIAGAALQANIDPSLVEMLGQDLSKVQPHERLGGEAVDNTETEVEAGKGA